MKLTRKTYGKYQDRNIDLFTFSNENGLVVSLTNFGGIVTSLKTPDKKGRLDNIVLSYQSLDDYIQDQYRIGCLIGRYANRISEGRFQIDGQVYQLSRNSGIHHLHGGENGFSKQIWEAQPVREESGCGLNLSLISPDGEEGYPGTVDVQVQYILTPDNALIIEYTAASDRPTIINLTQHSYFNLAGKGTVHDHFLRINASGYTPVDKDLIPLGTLKSVEGSVFNFKAEKQLGQALDELLEAMPDVSGFDHNFVLDGSGEKDSAAATLYHPASGRALDIYTTAPGLQLYSGNRLHEGIVGKGGQPFARHGALCLETQHFPDSPNQRAFPSVVLRPGQVYRQSTRYQFGVR